MPPQTIAYEVEELPWLLLAPIEFVKFANILR